MSLLVTFSAFHYLYTSFCILISSLVNLLRINLVFIDLVIFFVYMLSNYYWHYLLRLQRFLVLCAYMYYIFYHIQILKNFLILSSMQTNSLSLLNIISNIDFFYIERLNYQLFLECLFS